MSITLESTSDSAEAVTAALGEPKVEETKTEPVIKAGENDNDSEVIEDEIVDEVIEDAEEDSDDDEVVDEEPVKISKSKKRMNKLYDKIGAAEERAIKAEAKLELLGQQANKGSADDDKIDLDDNAKPDEDAFDDYADFEAAKDEWQIKEAVKRIKAENSKDKMKTDYDSKLKTFGEKNTEFGATKEDHQEVLKDIAELNVPLDIKQAIMESDNGPELLYELAKDLDEFKRICQLSPLQSARAIGRFESKLNKSETKKETKKSIKSKAPKPMSQIRGSGASSAGKSIYDTKTSQKDFERMRNEQKGDRLY